MPCPRLGGTMDAGMRRPGLLLLLGLGIAVVVWIAWPGADDGDARLRADGERRGSHAASLHADGDDPGALTPALAGRGEEETKEPARGDVEVLVLGPHGQPLPKLTFMLVPVGSGGRVEATTDGNGQAILRDVPLDGSASVICAHDLSSGAHAVTGNRLVVRLERGVPIVLALVDAETGHSGPRGNWSFDDLKPEFGVRQEPHNDQQPHVLLAKPGSPTGLRLHLDVVGSGVAADLRQYHFWVSRRARSLYLRYPVRREAMIYAEVTDATGRDVDDTVIWIEPKMMLSYEPLAVPHRAGSLQLRGVPFFRSVHISFPVVERRFLDLLKDDIVIHGRRYFPGGRLAVFARHCGVLSGAMPIHPDVPLQLRGTLPGPDGPAAKLPSPPFDCRPSWYESLSISLRSPPRPDDPAAEFQETKKPQDSAGVTVSVVRRDGSSWPGDLVGVYGPNADTPTFVTGNGGRLTLSSVVSGTYHFVLLEPGTVATTVQVAAVAGRSAQAVLAEADGGTLDVKVTDSDGHGLPHALVSVTTALGDTPISWEDEEKGIQRIDPFTDHVGHRLYKHVSPGKVVIRAAWANRYGTSEVEVIEGETTDVEIVLHPPK